LSETHLNQTKKNQTVKSCEWKIRGWYEYTPNKLFWGHVWHVDESFVDVNGCRVIHTSCQDIARGWEIGVLLGEFH